MLKEIARSETAIHFYNEAIDDENYLSKKLGINKEIILKYPSWYEIDGELYYFKNIFDDIHRLINELLGVYLAKYFGLKTIEYQLGMKMDNNKYQTGILSKNIYNTDKEYQNLYDIVEANVYGNISNDCINSVFALCKTKKEKERVMLQILKMSLLDFYSHQVDRVYPNISFQIKPSIALGPIYDYEETFDVEQNYATTRQYLLQQNINWNKKGKYIYQSDLIKLEFPSDEVYQLFEQYPQFYNDFSKILDLDLEKYLKLIEKRNDIKIPNWLFKHYMDYDKEQKDFVKKIR